MFRTTFCPFGLRTASTKLKDPSSKLGAVKSWELSNTFSPCGKKIWKICETTFNQSSSGHQKELYFFHCNPFVSPKLCLSNAAQHHHSWMNECVYNSTQERLCFLRDSQCPRSAFNLRYFLCMSHNLYINLLFWFYEKWSHLIRRNILQSY